MPQMPSTSSVPLRATLPWDAKLWSKFEDVPKNDTDENSWYGPWDTILHRLFRDNEGFQIVLQHLKMGCRGEPKWSVFYLVKAWSILMCVIEVKLLWHLKCPQRCIDAYNQVLDCLKEFILNCPPIPTLYGLSVVSDCFLIVVKSGPSSIFPRFLLFFLILLVHIRPFCHTIVTCVSHHVTHHQWTHS